MLGTEQRDQLNAGCVREEIDGAAALRIEAGMIGDQADVFSTERGEFFGFEDVYADLHASRAARVFRVSAGLRTRRTDQRQRENRRSGTRQESRSSRHWHWDHPSPPKTAMILWNVPGGLALFA